MNNLFNTQFEISLRTLIILATSGGHCETADMIAAADFITVYGRDFGISGMNLHGDNNYRFSEFVLRRELVKKAVKLLVVYGLINVSTTDNGFSYSINQNGIAYCAKFTTDYADTYRRLAKQTRTYIADKSEREIFKLINQHSLFSLQRSEIDV
ncbi:MAG: hypothetical protein PHR65_02335 [Syntrophomonadaceae bacterium]|nr:hypothetical protein [Syntrophomonadaceae bacterium]